jgi:hypothetical protein
VLFSAVLLGGLITVTAHPPAEASLPIIKAAPEEPARRATTPDVVRSAALDANDDHRSCVRLRKRLWDGQGWVVRSVTLCR